MKVKLEGSIDLKQDPDHYWLQLIFHKTRKMLESHQPENRRISEAETVDWIVKTLEMVYKYQRSYIPTIKKFSKKEGVKID